MSADALPTVRTVAGLRAAVAAWRAEGRRVAVVPTMGALHEGHLSLVALARRTGARVVATLFVNPRQFDRPEDLAAYPSTEEADRRVLEEAGCDLLFAPEPAEMYPPGFSTTVSVSGVSAGLCGGARPGHFDGVATVVLKLLLQTGADLAVFGEKDFQQLAVVRRLVADLDVPVEILAGPTVRDPDGLALSSRNRRLSAEARSRAAALPGLLGEAAERLRDGGEAGAVLEAARAALLGAGFTGVDYLELRAESDLGPLDRVDRPARFLAAAWIDGVRLIDNLAVAPRADGRAPARS